MSSWACRTGTWYGTGADQCRGPNGSTFQHDITLNLYEVDAGDPTGVGAPIASFTVDQTIPYRPRASNLCDGKQWRDAAGGCWNGLAFNLDFDTGGVLVPRDFIASITYNTNTAGYAPTGVEGPADSLNVAVTTDSPSVGTDLDPSDTYISRYSPGGIPNPFARDTTTLPGYTIPFKMNMH